MAQDIDIFPISLQNIQAEKTAKYWYFLNHENVYCEYSLEVPHEALLMSTHNMCSHGEIRKKKRQYLCLTLVLLDPDMSCLCKQCRARLVGF